MYKKIRKWLFFASTLINCRCFKLGVFLVLFCFVFILLSFCFSCVHCFLSLRSIHYLLPYSFFFQYLLYTMRIFLCYSNLHYMDMSFWSQVKLHIKSRVSRINLWAMFFFPIRKILAITKRGQAKDGLF